ncbi:MAG TPA: RNA polymerase sigma factor [Kofleriaceae bacterium]|nr:RNA polymerase sigma factor [Kofleriaceae bacterium]
MNAETAIDPAELSDEALVARVRAGEGGLFEVLMRRHNQRAYRAARAIVRNDAEAEDVAQEAWVAAFSHLGAFEGRSAFSTWLTRIVINEALARLRRQKRAALPLDEGAPMSRAADDPERDAWRAELSALLEGAIDRLPLGHRAVFMLRMVEQLSVAETADSLGLSEEAVRTRLHRARAALRRDLLARSDAELTSAFGFDGDRCNRITAAVMARIRL